MAKSLIAASQLRDLAYRKKAEIVNNDQPPSRAEIMNMEETLSTVLDLAATLSANRGETSMPLELTTDKAKSLLNYSRQPQGKRVFAKDAITPIGYAFFSRLEGYGFWLEQQYSGPRTQLWSPSGSQQLILHWGARASQAD